MSYLSKLKIGDKYFSVGPLGDENAIEKWEYTRDRFDAIRIQLGNFFFTKEEAIEYRNKLINMKKDQLNGK